MLNSILAQVSLWGLEVDLLQKVTSVLLVAAGGGGRGGGGSNEKHLILNSKAAF